MKPIHLTLKKRFAVIVWLIAILTCVLFITALNQLEKVRDFNSLSAKSLAIAKAKITIDSVQSVMFIALPRDLNFYKGGKNQYIENLKEILSMTSVDANKLANDFYLISDKQIKLKVFHIDRELRRYKDALDNYTKFISQRGFSNYGINGQINVVSEYLLGQCKAEGLNALEDKVNGIISLKNQYLLEKEPSLINKIKILSEEAQAYAVLSGKFQKLTLIAKIQKLENLIVSLNDFDEAIGVTNYDGMVGTMNNAKDQFAVLAAELHTRVNHNMQSAVYFGYIWLSLILILLLLSFYRLHSQLNKYIHRPFEKMKSFLTEMVMGQLPTPLKLKRNDEITDMANHLNKVVEGLQRKAEFALEIGKGELGTHYQPLSENDILGNALIEMEKSLQKADLEDQKYKNEEKKRIWFNEGVARFSEILRLHNDNINKLADEIIQNLVIYLNAAQGNLFFYNDEENSNVHLELVAAYAYNRKKYIQKTIQLGEGLVGTVAVEKEKLFITEIPEDYLSISSGMGEAPPRCLLIIPLKLEDTVLGIVELASFHIFEAHEMEFIEKIGQTIASTITNVKINARTAKLLEQSQKQGEEMAEQEEEMRQNMEELRTTQEDFSRRETEINGFLIAIQNSSMILVLDNSGKIIDINDIMLDKLGSKREELIGRNHRDFSSLGRIPEDYDVFWKNILNGNVNTIDETLRLAGGKEIYFNQTFSPIIDKKGQLSKVLCISIDKTDTVEAEQKIDNNAIELNKLSSKLSYLNEAIDVSLFRCEYSDEGRIVEANSNFCKAIGLKFQEISGKHYSYFLNELSKEQHDKILADAIAEKLFSGEIKIVSNSGNETKLFANFTPVKNEKGKTKKINFIAYPIK
jgi:PAS domain S-box-containing protein